MKIGRRDDTKLTGGRDAHAPGQMPAVPFLLLTVFGKFGMIRVVLTRFTISHRQYRMTSIMKSGLIVSLWVALFTLSGCGKAPVAENSVGEPQVAQKEVTEAMEKFLNAVRSGNDGAIFNMLSPKAREVCGRDRLPSIPASDTANFRVDEVILLSDTEAQVRTTMIDLDETRQKVEDSIAWALRKTAEGWQIAGTAFVYYEGMEPIIVNFESREAIAQAEAQVEAQAKAISARIQELRINR